MTRKEAMELEEKVDKLFTEALDEDCAFSLSLSNKIRISFDENVICLNRDNNSAEWVNFQGFYSDLQHYINDIIECVKANKDIIDQLLWSYDHIAELED